MRKKIELFGLRMKAAVQSHPVEVSLSVLACAMGCYDYEREGGFFDMVLQYMPVVFLFVYTLNRCCARMRRRLLYYFSALLWIPFLMMSVERSFSSTHLVSLIIVILVYLGSGWMKDNKRFVENTLFFVRSLLYAGGLSVVIYLLAGSIYKSIQYIFEIWPEGSEHLITYTAIIVFSVVCPLLFLLFNERREDFWLPSKSKVFDVLLNYVLSPALLIYAGILYLYFIKIVFLWSLPKGGVAFIVVTFTLAVFILKGCQVFLARRYYDWFYDHASLAVLPALAMFWIGTLYRIGEYGFTASRVYLVVVGLILSGTALLFLVRRWASYLYVAAWSIFLLSVVTYIPGITAQDIECMSQMSREGNDPTQPWNVPVENIRIYSDRPIDIRGYEELEPLRNYEEKGAAWLWLEDRVISLYDREGTLIYQKSHEEFLDEQLRKVGLSRSDSIPESVYPDLLRIELDSSAIILEEFELRRDTTLHLNYVLGAYYLK